MVLHPVRSFGRIFAQGLLAAASAIMVGAPASQAPWAAWRTLATAHYRIHYPPPLEDWAQDVAGRIEAIHARVTGLVGYQCPGPIQVELEDPEAEANGEAVPLLPAAHVVLWRTEPRSDSLIGASMSQWTEVLLAHELTHIHHLTRPSQPGQVRGIRSLFSLPLGPLLLKSPRWISEGYATLMEGRITGTGRPHSSIRAAVLRQWARAGKLPPYQALSRGEGYLGGSMAYLVGSAYLEWLERQCPDQPDCLQRLWKQMASGRNRSFEAAFQATFGFTALDGYQRFQAETCHDALEWETRIKAQGLREGALWFRSGGGVADLGVSPDGSKLLACLETRRGGGLRVWALTARAAPAKARPADPFNGVEDAPPEYPAPTQLARLPTLDHRLPRQAEWVDDRTVLFQLKHADGEGTSKFRPALWRMDGGLELSLRDAPVPHGRTLVPVHRPGGWQLELDGQTVPLPGQAAGRAWVDAGRGQIFAACELDGIWNLVRVPFRREGGALGFGAPQRLTRSIAAAWNPAPTPDGQWLFYTSLDARGMEIRKLDLALPPLEEKPAPEARTLVPDTVMPPAPVPGALPPAVVPPPATTYRALDNLWNHPAAGISLTPSGDSCQVGMAGSDLLGRLSWQILAGLGNGAGPRGAVAGVSSAAWPWRPSLTLFSALERPSLQQSLPLQADRSRRGAEAALTFDHLGDTRFWFSPVASWERVQPRSGTPGTTFSRGLAGLRTGLDVLWARGPWGFELTPGLQAYGGSTLTPGGSPSWTALRTSLILGLETPLLPVAFKGEQGRFRGNAQETFHLGGVTTSLVPESLDLGRIVQPALPAGTATGDRFLRWRGELGSALHIYEEGTALWYPGQQRGPWLRVAGVEYALDLFSDHGSEQALQRMKVQAGVHRPLDGVMKGRTVATLTLMLRP